MVVTLWSERSSGQILAQQGSTGPPPGQASHTLIVICPDSDSDSYAHTQMSIHPKIQDHTLGHIQYTCLSQNTQNPNSYPFPGHALIYDYEYDYSHMLRLSYTHTVRSPNKLKVP